MQRGKVPASTLRRACLQACYLHACTLYWGSASVICVPTGIEPLAVCWCSRAHSAPTTCLVPGRVTGLLQGRPPRWAGVVVCECVHCVMFVYNMWVWGAVAAWEEGKVEGAGSKLVYWTSRLVPQEGFVLWSLGAATTKSQWKCACPSLSPSVCLPVHLHPKLVYLSF